MSVVDHDIEAQTVLTDPHGPRSQRLHARHGQCKFRPVLFRFNRSFFPDIKEHRRYHDIEALSCILGAGEA